MYCGSDDACAFAAFANINVFLLLEKSKIKITRYTTVQI